MDFIEREHCPACLGSRSQTLLRVPFHEGPLGDFLRHFYQREPYEGTYRLDECLDCTLIFQRYIPDAELMGDLYARLARPELDVPNPPHPRDEHELRSLSAFLGKSRLKVLDYGTGWGAWPIAARTLGHDAFAIELSCERADWVQRQGVKMIADADIARHEFDVINLEQVLEHVAEPVQLLGQLTRSLRGVLKLSLPNSHKHTIRAIARGDHRRIMPFHPWEHVNSFNPVALRKLIERLGLREAKPTSRQLYSFRPASIRDAVRPVWRYHNPVNLYVWATL